VFVLHFGALVLAVPAAILAGSFAVFLEKALPVLVIFYGLLFAAFVGWKLIRGALAKSTGAARLITAVPVMGTLLERLTAWKFSLVLSLYVRAGGGLLKAFGLAGDSCGNCADLFRQCESRAPGAEWGNAGGGLCTQPGLPELLERSIEVGRDRAVSMMKRNGRQSFTSSCRLNLSIP